MFQKINILVWTLIKKILTASGEWHLRALFLAVIECLNRCAHKFYTYEIRDKKPAAITDRYYICQANASTEKTAVVIQGPIRCQDQFTLETVRWYRKVFPSATIIVSTWNTESAEILHQLESAGAVIVTSALPEIRGVANVNCQICSTLAGIQKAETLGIRHVLKTRSDQRIYAWNTLRYFYSLQKTFPAAEDVPLAERLIISSGFTRRFIPFHFGDFFMFGTVEDLKLFWEQPASPVNQRGYFRYYSEVSPENCAEMFMGMNFAGKLNCSSKDLMEYYRILKKCFCIVNLPQLDLYWPSQYAAFANRESYRQGLHTGDLCLTHEDWLCIYNDEPELLLPPEKWEKQDYETAILI